MVNSKQSIPETRRDQIFPVLEPALTGSDIDEDRGLLETNRKGIFAIGEVRSGSVKRVAAAVGEGAQVITMLHATLRGLPSDLTRSASVGVAQI